MAMYFVQHGKALDKKVDPERPLSAEGRQEVEHISNYLREVGISVTKIYHSGKTRARETAQIFGEIIGEGLVWERPGMGPNDDVKAFSHDIETEDIMYVGHLPHLGKLVSLLTTGHEEANVVRFENGGVVCIEEGESGFHIEWYIKPSLTLSKN